MAKKRRTVLIVSPSPQDCNTFRRYLMQDPTYHYTLLEAAQGQIALALAAQERPDAILLDYHLPDMDGLEFLAAFTRQADMNAAGIVLLNKGLGATLAVQAMQAGAHDYLSKGKLSAGGLQRAVAHAIEKVELQRELEQQRVQLAQSQAFTEKLFATAPAIIYLFEPETGRNLFVSPQSAMALGYAPGEIEFGSPDFQQRTMHPDDLARLPRHFERLQALSDGQILEFEYRMCHRDGTWRWFHSRDSVFARSSEGKVRQVLGVALDITERKQQEQVLQGSQRLLQRIAETTPHLLYLYDLSAQRNIYANNYLTEALGYTPAEIQALGENFLPNLMHPDDWAATPPHIAQLLALAEGEISEWEYRMRHKNGEWRWLYGRETVFSRDEQGQVQVILGTTQDITERKQAEEALRQSEERFRVVWEISHDAKALSDSEGVVMAANPAYSRLYGYPPEQVVGHDFAIIFPEEQRAWAREQYRAVFAAPTAPPVFESIIRRADGTQRMVESRVEFITQGERRVAMLSVLRDITERKEAEAERERLLAQLSAERVRLEAVLQHMPAGVTVAEAPSGRLIFGNRQVEQIWRHAFIASERIADYEAYPGFHVDGRPYRAEEWPLARAVSRGETVLAEEIYFLRGDGSYGLMSVNAAPVQDAAGQVSAGVMIFSDITAQKEAEAERQRQAGQLRQQAQILSLAHIIVRNLADEIITWNPGAEELYGYTQAEALGRVSHALLRTQHSESPRQIRKMLRRTGQWEGELTHVTREGKIITVASHQTLYRDERGQAVAILEVNNDITALKESQAALRLSEQRLSTVLEQLPVAVWLTDIQGNIVLDNPASQRIWGKRPAGAEHMGQFKGWWSDSGQPLRNQDWSLARVLSSGQPALNELIDIETFGGERKTILSSTVPILAEAGQVTGAVVVNEDVTQLRQAEQALRQAQSRLEVVLRAGRMGWWERNLLTEQSAWSDSMFAILGEPVRPEQQTHDFFMQHVHPEDRPQVEAALERAISRGSEYSAEFRVQHGPLGVRWVLEKGQVFYHERTGQPERFVGVTLDITLRKQIEHNLQESEATLRSFYDSAPTLMGIVEITENDILHLYDNAATHRFFAVSGSTTGRRASELGVAPAHLEIWLAHYRAAESGGQPQSFEYIFADSPNGPRWLAATVSLIGPDRFGRNRFCYVAEEATERQRVAEVLERYRLLSERTHDIVLFVGRDGRLVEANRAAEAAYGYERAELLNLTIHDLRDPATVPEVNGQMAQADEARILFETRHRRRDGSLFPVEVSSIGATLGGERLLLSIIRDITERKQAEERFRLAADAGGSLIYEVGLVNGATTIVYGLERVTGYSPAEITPSSEWWYSLIHPDDLPGHLTELEQQLQRGEAAVAEYRLRRKEGAWRHVQDNRLVVHNAHDQPVRLIGAVTDITERKQGEERLRQNEERQTFLLKLSDALRPLADPVEIQYQAARLLGERLEANRVGYAEDYGDGETVVVTRHYTHGVPSIEGQYRYDDYGPVLLREFRAGRTVVRPDIAHDPTLTEAEKEAHAVLQLGATVNVPLVKAGRLVAILFVHCREAQFWSDSEVALMEETAERIWAAVERARAETALRESEERFRSLFESIDEGFVIVEMIFDAQGKPVDYRFEQANPQFTQLTGLPEDALGKTARELVPGLEDFWVDTYGRVALTGEAVRFENKSEPMERWFDVYASRVGRPDNRRVAIVFNNITERKQAEEALRRLQERFTIAEAATASYVYEYDYESGQVYRSPNFAVVTGYGPEEAPSSAAWWLSLLHPDDLEVIKQAEQQVREGQEERISWEYRVRHKAGYYLYLWDQSHIIRDEQGRAVRLIGSTINITDRKLAEETIRRQLEEIEAIYTNAPVGLAVLTPELRFERINERLAEINGLPVAAHLGKTVAELLPDLAEQGEVLARQIMETGEPILNIEIVGETPAQPGVRRTWLEHWLPQKNAQGQVYCISVVTEEITERRRAETRQQVLAETGRLLSTSLNMRTRLRELAEIIVETLAQWCVLNVVEADGTIHLRAAAHHDSPKTALLYEWAERYPVEPDVIAGVSQVVREGRAKLYPDLREASPPQWAKDRRYRRYLKALGGGATIIAPLVAHGRILGSMTLVSRGGAAAYEEADLFLAEELARRAAYAIDNARLYHIEQEARQALERAARRMARLYNVTAALSETLTSTHVFKVMVREGIAMLGAQAGIIQLLTAEGEALETVYEVGYPPNLVASVQRIPLSAPIPGTEVVRTGELLWFETRQELATRYPHLAETSIATGYEASIIVPLIIEERNFGVMGFSFVERREPNEEEGQFLLTLARQGAQALERARLYEAEQRARAEVEAAQQSLLLLAEARERNRLAQELHDSVAQVLGYANLKLAALNYLLAEGETAEVSAGLQEVKQIVAEAYTDVREEIFNLRVGDNLALNFLETLRNYIDKYRRFYGLDTHLTLEAPEKIFNFPPAARAPLIRTVQEALMNVRKHAGVKEAVIRLGQGNNGVYITVEDQGQGFELAGVERQPAEHFGLKIMRERIEGVGGRLQIESKPGQGTRVRLFYPL